LAAAALAVGIVLGATRDDRRLADHYRATLAEADGSSFEAARLTAPGVPSAGVVYAYSGRPSWIFIYVDRAHRAVSSVELALTSGRIVPLPGFEIDPVTGSAGHAIHVDVDDIETVRLVGPDERVVLEARLPR
jgi:hypothetical protein